MIGQRFCKRSETWPVLRPRSYYPWTKRSIKWGIWPPLKQFCARISGTKIDPLSKRTNRTMQWQIKLRRRNCLDEFQLKMYLAWFGCNHPRFSSIHTFEGQLLSKHLTRKLQYFQMRLNPAPTISKRISRNFFKPNFSRFTTFPFPVVAIWALHVEKIVKLLQA